jgi:hypothetical protein
MRRFLLTVAAAATTLASTACSDAIGIGGNVAGTYELRTFNGQTLPADDGFGVTIFSGVLELDNNGTFIDLLQFRVPGDPRIQDDELAGTWDQSGNEIRLDYNNGRVLFAERPSSGRIIIEDDDGNRLEYRRF